MARAAAGRWAPTKSSSVEVKPEARLVTYNINMKRVIQRKLFMGIADASMDVDGKTIYSASGLRVGLFTNTFESTP